MVTDTIINAIATGKLNSQNVSFFDIKRLSSRNHDRWNELGRGRAILSLTEQLDQYLYSYGRMTEGQWSTFLKGMTLPDDKPVYITDYGCGQGLATALLFDQFKSALRAKTSTITLIEPSEVALARANSIASIYCSHAEVNTINKALDDLSQNELKSSSDATNIHIFSNVLDIDGFDTAVVFNKIFSTSGCYIVLAVSHNRDFHGGAERIKKLDEAIRDSKHSKWLKIQKSKISEFDCPNQMPAISWELRVQVIS